ncbi:MAG: MobF family relaxase [Chthoniobacteraceae bacterium]
MISPKTQYSLANAKNYFAEHLAVGDYYSEGEHVAGAWCGRGAELLGLTGKVSGEHFIRLCENLHPLSGKLLTQRKKTTRKQVDESGGERDVANRRVFYDFTISPPKSVSVLALIGKDQRIIQSHARAMKIALAELERFAATRVHRGKTIVDRLTNNVAAASFQHDTSRALDPHLHTHCIVFNATFDAEEKRWKALHHHQMLVAQKYVENVYYHELARDLRRFGYEIENRTRGDFEIAGIAADLCERFSKRHAEIDEKTKELLANAPEKQLQNIAEIRDHIAHNERSRKIKNVPRERLRELWDGQLSPEERESIAAVVAGAREGGRVLKPANAEEAVRWAEDHLFDRKSVVHEHELWRHALVHVRGQDLDIGELHQATAAADYLRDERHPGKVSTEPVLSREWDILARAKDGVGKHEPMSGSYTIANDQLDMEQRAAVVHILNSRNFLTLFRGGAGTGKSFTLREVEAGLQAAGHQTCVVAPQRQQVIDLARDGFANTRTVSELLTVRDGPPGVVVILDEAGQLGAKQMKELLDYVSAIGGRLIASGDTRQHGAVEASDALRAIEKYSGLVAAELTTIRRQDPSRGSDANEREFIQSYKAAVAEAAEGNVAAAFDKLDAIGAVIGCVSGTQQELIAEHYLALAVKNESSVVVSQTWSEIRQVNEAVRLGLKARGLLGDKESKVVALERIDLTDAQKRDPQFYEKDSVIAFNRRCAGFEKGDTGRLIGVTAKGVVVEVDGLIGRVSQKHLERITVCRPRVLTLARGDRLQLKANARARAGEALANGELVTVLGIDDRGAIKLTDGRILPPCYRQFVPGYAVTSYGSQGKTVDHVLFSDSAVKAATNRQQWYVTISRGRRSIRIFTSDKMQLRENISRCGDRELALDIFRRSPIARSPAIRNAMLRRWRRGRGIAAALWQTIRNAVTAPRPNFRAEVSP